MTRLKKNIIGISVAMIVLVVIAGGIIVNMFLRPISIPDIAYIYIDSDDNIDSVRSKIKSTNADISMTAFDWLVQTKHYDEHIRPGRYEVSNTMSTLDFYRNLRNHNSIPINLVVPSVRTVDLMASRLSRQLMLDSATISKAFHDPEILQQMGFTSETFPSFFIPNTYEVYWETSIDALLARLTKEYKAFWNNERTLKASQIGLTQTEVITLASIVDSETANNGEKPRIAGLYMNRLHRGILLQSDPTVIFAVGDFSIRRVLNIHLQTPSPYNTYLVKGLPPGPIRIPSVAGIESVLNYEHNNYIYMCAKEDFSGTHNFATSYSEHMINARRYINALNQRGIK